jgi:hypothetical protein
LEVSKVISKRKSQDDDANRLKRIEQDKALDEALKDTFPASDPISMEQSGRPDLLEPPAAH